MTLSADFVVVGSGLSGLNSVLAISRQAPNASIIVVEPQSLHTGASSAPMALLNPSTSRSPNIIEEAEILLDEAISNYGDLKNQQGEPILCQKGIFKAVPLGENPEKWKSRYEKSYWPDGWSEWVDGIDVQKRLSMDRQAAPNGGILIHESWVISLLELRASLIEKCKQFTNSFIEEPIKKLDTENHTLILENLSISYANLLFANGYDLFNNSNFNDWITAHPIKGQMLNFSTSALPDFQTAITNSGYLGQLKKYEYAVGSTYEHSFNNELVDNEGKERLLKKARHLLGYELSEEALTSLTQWSAIRVASKDRKPLIGAHPSIKGLYLINGMASKGLIYSPMAAKRLVKYILGDKSALGNWDLQRYMH